MKESFITKAMFILYWIPLVPARKQYLIRLLAPNDNFFLNTLKTLFRLTRVLLDLQKCILRDAANFVPVRSSWGNLSLFEIALGLIKYYVLENFRCNLTYYERKNFSDSSLHHIFQFENFRFRFLKSNNSLTWVAKCKNLE